MITFLFLNMLLQGLLENSILAELSPANEKENNNKIDFRLKVK